jgi:hypothetical protein
MQESKSASQDKKINDAEYRLAELVYILAQADTRYIAFLKKRKKRKNTDYESCALHEGFNRRPSEGRDFSGGTEGIPA